MRQSWPICVTLLRSCAEVGLIAMTLISMKVKRVRDRI
jgi:hypothetical protein